MSEQKTEVFEGQKIRVISDPSRCMYAGECGGSGLKAVFSKENWINPDGADVDMIIDIIERCPSGSLSYERLDNAPQEAPEINSIQPAANSALFFRGDLKISNQEGETLEKGLRLALCRCGQSDNKPFCDGSHVEAGFQDLANVASNQLSTKALNTTGELTVTPLANGPLLVQGDFVLRNASNSSRAYGDKVALCRCGASASKPFCDGSHKKVGFKTE